MKEEDYIQSTTKTGNQRINCYGAFSKHKKYNLSFFKENIDSKIYNQCVKKIISEITESIGLDYIIYIDNDSKQISIESLKIYKSNLITRKFKQSSSSKATLLARGRTLLHTSSFISIFGVF